ncbi:MAG: type IV pilus twitching motility protein PilT [Candidatus Hydrogenedentota bacterium]
MVIGTRSSSTVFDVFRIAATQLIRQSGPPKEFEVRTQDCTLYAKAENLQKRVDSLRIAFNPKDGVTPEAVKSALESAPFKTHVKMDNGTCSITLPSFDWSQIAQLSPVDTVVEQHVAESLRSQSWRPTVHQYRSSGVNVNWLIEHMEEKNASDLHLRAGSRPYIRVDNELEPVDMEPLSADDMGDVVLKLGGEEEVKRLEAERENSFNYHSAGVGYLRVSGYIKQGSMALAIRLIPEEPPAFADLNIPDIVRGITNHHRGLFLVCGITGSGKSTTLAAMVDYINARRHAHIITVEDPIEYVYRDKESLISQRQIGRDTYSYANALRGALREDPDVILVGEMRDMDTIRAGVSAAETGHLVFSTLHTMTAVDTVNRVISYFPQNERDLIRQELAYTLSGVVCQRLLKRKGGGRVPCVEMLLGGKPIVRDAILEGEIDKLHDIIETDGDMTTFDQYAVKLYKEGVVDREEAVSACRNEEGFQRIISGIQSSEGRKVLGR